MGLKRIYRDIQLLSAIMHFSPLLLPQIAHSPTLWYL